MTPEKRAYEGELCETMKANRQKSYFFNCFSFVCFFSSVFSPLFSCQLFFHSFSLLIFRSVHCFVVLFLCTIILYLIFRYFHSVAVVKSYTVLACGCYFFGFNGNLLLYKERVTHWSIFHKKTMIRRTHKDNRLWHAAVKIWSNQRKKIWYFPTLQFKFKSIDEKNARLRPNKD